MRNLLKKLLVILFVALMLINNSLLTIISVAADEIENLIDQSKVNLTYSMNLEKYVNYSLSDEDKGLLVQVNLKTLIEYEEEKEGNITNATGIVLNLSKINDEYPENVEVLSNSLENVQTEYDKENGILQILELQKDECEYTIIISYSSNSYTAEEISRTLNFSGKVLAQLANEEETTIVSDINQDFEVDKNISNLISTSLETTDIYNGYINSNKENGTKYVTDYTENLKIDIGYREIADEVKVKLNNKFISGDELVDTNEIIFKSTKINKDEVLSKLGEEGYLKILNSDGDILGEINKETEAQEDGSVEFTYENEITELEIVMSKPIELGVLNIQNNKQIKDTMVNIENSKIVETHLIQGINNIEIVDNETGNVTEYTQEEIYRFESAYATEIKDSETRIDLSVDNVEWTNNVQNDVIFTATLVTTDSQYSLFKNPIIEIELPKEVEKVILGDVNLLYDNNLSILNSEVVEKENSKVIRVEVTGIQKEYVYNNLLNGAEIVIPATVIVSKEVEAVKTSVKYTYTNELSAITDYEREGKENKELAVNIDVINIMRMLRTSTVTSEEISSDNGQVQTEDISMEVKTSVGDKILADGDIIYEHEYVKYDIKLKNNTNSKIENINLVGTVPEGTTYVKCYFGEISYPSDYNLYKTEEDSSVTQHSELIELEPGEEKNISYYVRANYLDEDESEKNIESKISIEKDATEIAQYTINNKIESAEMELSLRAWETDRSDNLWLYEIKVTNNTDDDINDVVVNMDLQDEIKFSYIEEYVTEYSVDKTVNGINVNIPVLNADSTQRIVLFMQVSGTDDNIINYEITTCASAKGNGTNTYYSNIDKQIAHMAGIQVIQTSEKECKELKYDEEIEYNFVIKNVSDKDIRREAVSLELINYADKNLIPVSVEYEYYEYNAETYQYEKKTATKDLSSKAVPEGAEASSIADLYLILAIPKEKEVNLTMKFKAGEVYENTETSNCLKIVYDYLGAHTVTSNIVKNTILPRFTSEDIENPDDTEIPDDEENPDDGEEPDDGENPDDGEEPDDEENPDDEDTSKKYSISGFAWEDKNKNGKFDDSENKLSNITVKLFNSETNAIVKDEDGNNFEILTNSDGEYSFNNVEKGKYLVLFEYDDNNYSLTTYKKNSVSEDINSDVIKKQAAIDGVEKIVAVTDILNIESSNLTYINMGLIKNEKFDLSLDKSISKIILKYDSFNKEYTYDKIKLAKIEVPSKKISSASIEVEYLLEVKNEGDVDAYVDEIVDYLPEGFTFDSELNDGWYSSGNGILKNISYAGVIINPGESKTVKLYLTRTLTSDSIGVLENSAEILKSSSINGGSDIDSINGNKIESEDDYSSAELIIGIKTGALLYTGIIGLILAILLILKMLIDKKIINIKKIQMFSIAFILISTMFVCNYSIGGDSSAATYTAWTFEQAKTYVENHYVASSTSSVGCYYTTTTDNNSSNEGYDWTVTGATTTTYTHTNGVTNTSPTCSDTTCTHTSSSVTEYRHHKAVNYIHHGASSSVNGLTKSGGALYCTDAEKMSSASPGWSYSFNKINSLTISSVSEYSRRNVATITDNGSNPDFTKCYDSDGDSKYYLVGPYNVNFSGTIYSKTVNARKQSNNQLYEVSDYKIVNANNEEISITSGSNFYLRVPKSVTWIDSINIKVKKVGSIKYKITYTYQEHWTCGVNGAQVLGKDGSNDNYITDEISTDTYNEITLGGAKLPIGKLTIYKEDYDTGARLKGYKITVENEEYCFKKTIVIGETEDESSLPSSPFTTTYNNGKITISNLPSNTTYVVTEIKPPNEYKLSLQDEDWIKKTITVKVNDTVSVKLKDRLYGDLRIVKMDKDTYKKMDGVGFIIFRKTSEGKTYYIKNYKWKSGDPAYFKWTQDETEADVFYTGETANVDSEGYTNGNSSTSKGTILLQNLPLYYNGEKITYNMQEYKFDYDFNPDLMYYKLDRTIIEKMKLISESYTNNDNIINQAELWRTVTLDFYGSDYVKKYTKTITPDVIVNGMWVTITNNMTALSSAERNQYISILNSSRASDGTYDSRVLLSVANEIFSKAAEKGILMNRASQIYDADDTLVEYRDSLFTNIGITGSNVKQSMKDYCLNRLNCQTVVLVRNTQYVIDIAGLVWEDIATSKITVGNNVYDKNQDLLANDVTVRLFAEVDPDGKLPTLSTKTDTNGKYLFKGSQFIYRTINGNVYQEFTDEDNKLVYVMVKLNSSTGKYEIDKNLNGKPKSVLDSNKNALTAVSYKNSNLEFKNSSGTQKYAIPKVQMNIIINNLNQYNIEFEYNGLKYKCVLTEKEKNNSTDSNYVYKEENSSKAKENETNRQNFNYTYSRITGGSAKNTSNSTTIGYSTDDSRNNENKLTYTGDDTKSELVQNTKYSVESASGSVDNSNLSGLGVVMTSTTKEAQCNFEYMHKLLPDGAREISNVNLGLVLREQPDLAIATDVENVQLSINGYNHTYNYQQRANYENQTGVPDAEINPGYDAAMDGFSVSVKRNNGNYKNLTYVRDVYDSYIAYTNDYYAEGNIDHDKLRMFVTYKIVVTNQSSSLINRVRLRNYADARYESVYSSKIVDKDGNEIDITNNWKNKGNVNNGKTNYWETDELLNANIYAGSLSNSSIITVYLTYEVSTETISGMMSLGNDETLEFTENTTEIIEYSTWNKDGKVYAGIDKDSAPNNMTYMTINTYEDDTDAAPGFGVKRKESKLISGIVFEDNTGNDALDTGEERIGDGIYQDSEKKVDGVEVNIKTYDSNPETIKLYNINDNNQLVITNAQDLTESDGKYEFTGLVPGEYYIEYTYGKYKYTNSNIENSSEVDMQTKVDSKEITTEEYKSTIVDKDKFEKLIEDINKFNGTGTDYYNDIENNNLWYWYENAENFNLSSAVDDGSKRDSINEYLSTINYKVQTDYKQKQDDSEKHYIKAYTGIIDWPVEDSRDQKTDYNYVEGSRNYQIKFGIVERPRQSVNVNKEISHICLTLANGQILVQGDPRNESINYVTYPDGGTLKIEVDNEIIEGATLDIEYEITVENESELEYDAKKYYRYGDSLGLSPVKIKLDSIVDYVDEQLSITYDVGSQNSKFRYYDAENNTLEQWQIILNPDEGDNANILAGISIDSDVYQTIRTRTNIAVMDTEREISPGDTTVINLAAKKLLTDLNENDQTFNNYVELIQVSNSVGRFYGQMVDDEWEIKTPGNFIIQNSATIKDTDECDNSNYSRSNKRNAQLTVVPPTGMEDIVIYVLVGLGCLVVLSGGIILIKKKVLD